MTLDEYLAAINTAADKPASWRVGQYAFNLLWDARPDLSEQIRATNFDPFHKDYLPSRFVEWVKDNW